MTEKSEIITLRKKLDEIEEAMINNSNDGEDFSFKPDKQKHLFVGILMGIFLSSIGIWGLCIGWVVIVGWELFQGWSNTGVAEFSDILYGGVPFTVVWLIAYFFLRKKK